MSAEQTLDLKQDLKQYMSQVSQKDKCVFAYSCVKPIYVIFSNPLAMFRDNVFFHLFQIDRQLRDCLRAALRFH